MTAARKQSRWWRRLGWSLLALAALPLLLLCVAEVVVRLPGVRQTLAQRISATVSERTGVSLGLDSLWLSLIRSEAIVEGITVGRPEAAPIVSIARLEVDLRLASLWNPPLTLERLIVARPVIDLEAPRPEPVAAESAGDSTGFALAIEHFELVDGQVDGPVLPAELEAWIEDWWLEDLRISGHYGASGLAAGLDGAWRVRRVDGVDLEAEIAAAVGGPQAGPWQLETLTLQGQGIEAELSATIGLAEIDPLTAAFELTLEPHLLVPVPAASGPIRLGGGIDARQQRLTATLSAAGLPSEIARPWLPESVDDDSLLRDWRVDVEAELDVTGTAGEPILEGTSQLALARQGVVWVSGEIAVLPPADDQGAHLEVDLLLLPERPGRREVDATILAPSWAEIAELARIDTRLQIIGTDLEQMRRDLETLAPELLPEGVRDQLVGLLQADVRLSGPVDDLRYQVAADWRSAESDHLQVRLSGSVDRVVIESASGALAGQSFSGRGAVSLPVPVAMAELELTLPEPHAELERLDLVLRLERGVALIEARPTLRNGVTPILEGTVPLASLGEIPTLAEALAGLPIERARGPLQVRWQVPAADWSDRVPVTEGGVELERLWAGSSGDLSFDLAVPLAATGAVTFDELAVATEELTVTAEGPVRIRLDRGEVILEPVRLSSRDGTLELEAWSRIRTDWRPEQPVDELIERFRIDANGAVPVALLGQFVDGIRTDGDLQVAVSLAGRIGDLEGEVRVLGPDAVIEVGEIEVRRLTDPALELSFAEDRIRIDRAQVVIDEGVVGATGEIQIDPENPLAAVAWLEVSPLMLTADSHTLEAAAPIRIELADGRIDIVTLELTVDDQPFAMSGTVELDRNWTAEDEAPTLIEGFDLQGQGTVAAILLNPFLAGGSAEGLLEVDFRVQGTPEDPRGRVRVAGPDASVLYFSPYVVQLEAPELDLELVDGRVWIRDGRVRLNDGDVELDGSLGLDGVDIAAAFDSLRFRLDHGLLVRLDGDLELTLDPEGRGRLAGEVIVDQGSLTRPISIDRDFLTDLLTPIDLTGTEESLLEQIELDLRLNTRRGVRVRNNVADLGVDWNDVRVRGNLLQPVIDGRFTIEPGGRAYLFGQTLRIDRGVLTYPGQPGAEAILDLETTSSLDDPSIRGLAGDDVLSLGSGTEEIDLEAKAREAGWSTAAFLSEQVATRITEAVPGARLTFRPILIFGEADPGARLTIGRDFSRYVTLAASLDLRNAERQTYLMDAHGLPGLPGVVLQVYTNDQEQEGATLQHRLRFGRHRRTAPTGPTIRRIEIDEVPQMSRRQLRRSIGLIKGDRATDDDLFLAEVEIGEFLRTAGYPDARVRVRARPVAERPQKVDLDISVRAGPFVEFEFTGEELSRALERSITPLYRSDFYEPVALEEMEAQSRRALRSLGYLEPEVEIDVEVGQTDDGREQRLVTIDTHGGQRARLDDLEITGLSEAEAARVGDAFTTRLRRAELAAAEPAADRRLLGAVQGLGYPAPEIVGREISSDGRQLRIEVEPGTARTFGTVTVRGVEPSEAEVLASRAGIGPGEVARRDRIATGALAIEAELRARGYRDASVRPRLEGDTTSATAPLDVAYEVDPGRAYTVAETDFTGLQSTSRRWATNVAEMESGAPLREDEVAAARSRLYETGLFTMVRTDTFVTDGGGSEIVFDVEERPRFSVAYGVRWDSGEGTQAVVDVIDENFLGRSITLAVRGLYKENDWNLRLAAGVPRLFGTRAVLELFGSYQDTFDEFSDPFFTTQFDEQTVETSLQVAYPFGRAIWGRVYGRYRSVDLLVTELDQDPIFPLPPTELEFRFKTPLLGTLWLYDTRDRELVLSRGTFASVDLSGTGKVLDSDFEYVRLFTQLNLYRPVARWAGRRLSWAQSLRLGLADSFEQELDRNDRFFAGGQYSVRGYLTDSLGPVEVLGEVERPLGGKTLLVINEELRFDLLGPVAGVVFLDLGNVWEDTAEFSTDLFKSLGLGLRAVTPIGLLRLDWAFPLDRRELDPSNKIYFGFGNTF